jgi:hypothetical protein
MPQWPENVEFASLDVFCASGLVAKKCDTEERIESDFGWVES